MESEQNRILTSGAKFAIAGIPSVETQLDGNDIEFICWATKPRGNEERAFYLVRPKHGEYVLVGRYTTPWRWTESPVTKVLATGSSDHINNITHKSILRQWKVNRIDY